MQGSSVDCMSAQPHRAHSFIISDIPSRRHLIRSATRHHLTVPRYRLSTFGRRAFSVAGPTVCNSLPDSLRDPALSSNSFRQSLKTNLFRRYHSAHTCAVEMLHDSALYKSIIDIDIDIDIVFTAFWQTVCRRKKVILQVCLQVKPWLNRL